MNSAELTVGGYSVEEFGEHVAEAAHSYLKVPFIDHDRTIGCGMGPANDACMSIGLGESNMDCSGLIVRSVTDVLDIPYSEWPRSLRHIRQMQIALEVLHRKERIARVGKFLPGDLLFRLQQGIPYPIHAGIAIAEAEMVHATSLTNTVSKHKNRDPIKPFMLSQVYPAFYLARVAVERMND